MFYLFRELFHQQIVELQLIKFNTNGIIFFATNNITAGCVLIGCVFCSHLINDWACFNDLLIYLIGKQQDYNC